MNIYKCLNDITDYIDDNLEEKIDYDVLAKKMSVNSYTMQRIFSLLTGITITEYIRKRKLSNAGYDLYEGNYRIIDIALKYNYENATSFSRAFENFHGIKPSHVNKQTKLKNYPKLTFDEKIIIKEELAYEIIELPELTLYGTSIATDNDHIHGDAPTFFSEVRAKYLDIYGEIPYGMTTYADEMREYVSHYSVLYDKEIPGFEKIIIPASKWISFTINSQNPQEIQDITDKFYYEFLPSCKYNLKEIPELEHYHDDITDFLVAIY